MFVALTFTLCCGAQDPAPAASRPTTPAVKQLSDDEAKAIAAAFKRDSSSKQASLEDRLDAVQKLGEGSHSKLVPLLERVVARGSSVSVRREAARLFAIHPAGDVRKSILKLLKDRAVASKPEIVADLVRSFDRSGYTAKDWKTIEKLFGDDYSDEHRPKQKAIFELIGNHKEMQGIELLLRNLDEPGQVENVNAADNPPAEYWEKRWKAWRSWRDELKHALFELTGQKFNSSEEARVWLSKNEKQLKRRR